MAWRIGNRTKTTKRSSAGSRNGRTATQARRPRRVRAVLPSRAVTLGHEKRDGPAECRPVPFDRPTRSVGCLRGVGDRLDDVLRRPGTGIERLDRVVDDATQGRRGGLVEIELD